MGKSIFASKTFWIGAGLAGLSGFSLYLNGLADTDPIVGLVAGLVVIINRYFTSEPIK